MDTVSIYFTHVEHFWSVSAGVRDAPRRGVIRRSAAGPGTERGPRDAVPETNAVLRTWTLIGRGSPRTGRSPWTRMVILTKVLAG